MTFTAGIIQRGLTTSEITMDRHIHPSFNSSSKQSLTPDKMDATNYGSRNYCIHGMNFFLTAFCCKCTVFGCIVAHVDRWEMSDRKVETLKWVTTDIYETLENMVTTHWEYTRYEWILMCFKLVIILLVITIGTE